MKETSIAKEKRLFSSKDLRRLIIPLLIEQFLAIFVGLADSIMVSSVGEAAVSAVSLIGTIMVLLINIFTALATGGAIVAGQASEENVQRKAVRQQSRRFFFPPCFPLWLWAWYMRENG